MHWRVQEEPNGVGH